MFKANKKNLWHESDCFTYCRLQRWTQSTCATITNNKHKCVFVFAPPTPCFVFSWIIRMSHGGALPTCWSNNLFARCSQSEESQPYLFPTQRQHLTTSSVLKTSVLNNHDHLKRFQVFIGQLDRPRPASLPSDAHLFVILF